MLIDFGWSHLFLGMAALVIVLIILWQQKRSLLYLLFFSAFWVYMMKLVSVVVFPFPASSGNPYFRPHISMVPFYFGSCDMWFLCMKSMYQNILLTIPFGFGISFVKTFKSKNILWLAFLVGLTLELIQLVISMIVRSSFRVADINDVLLNALGVLIGYGLFRLFGWFYLSLTQNSGSRNNAIFLYIYKVVQQSTTK